MDTVSINLKKSSIFRKINRIFIVFIFFPIMVYAQPELIAIQLLDITNHQEPVINIINLKIDQLWHSGKYEKIFPLFYLVTCLDPYDEEAWATGGWFLINCIAPSKSPSERKKIKMQGLDFLKQGLKYNPETYRLYWEIAWVYYIWGDFETSLKYLDSAINYEHPFYVENTRAHVLEKLGRIDDAIKQWKEIKYKFPEMKYVAERFITNLEKQKTNAQ